MGLGERVRALVAKDKLERAIEEFRSVASADTELGRELIQHQASLTRTREGGRRGLLPWSEEERLRTGVRFALLELLVEYESEHASAASASDVRTRVPASDSVATVFLSYAHVDRATAERLVAALRNRDVAVRIDGGAMTPGEDIRSFIGRAIRDTDATVCLVSSESLLSPWVAMEAVDTFAHEEWANQKKFIACYIDDGFLDIGFRIEATRRIDSSIEALEALIAEHGARRLDTNDLDDQKARLFELRNRLGGILQRLRGSLCLDVREPEFERSVARIVEALRPR
jgi:hypothetical protein